MRAMVIEVINKSILEDKLSSYKSLAKNKVEAIAMVEIRKDALRKWTVSGLGCLGAPRSDGRPTESDILRELSRIRVATEDTSENAVMYTWGGNKVDLPLLYLRGMAHGVRFPWIHDILSNKGEDLHIDLRDVMTNYEEVDFLPFSDLAEVIGGPVSFPFVDGGYDKLKGSYRVTSAYAQITVALVCILAIKHIYMSTDISPTQHDDLVSQTISMIRKKEETYSRNYRDQDAAMIFNRFLQKISLERMLYRREEKGVAEQKSFFDEQEA